MTSQLYEYQEDEHECCANCIYSAKFIERMGKKSEEIVCTVFLDKDMSDEPIIIGTTPNSLCEMFQDKHIPTTFKK